MTKEEFIKLLEVMEIEDIASYEITYCKKKPSKYNYGDDDCSFKTITFNKDLIDKIDKIEKYSFDRYCDLAERLAKIEEVK